ncbi:hypothetical protein [Microbacterium sp.]|uniref:hypothetical protein n=1 Tax=Microbacterium sp. TaxID=51671 RepID=UPI0039E2D2A4
MTEFLLGLASLLADLSGIDWSSHDAPFEVWLSLVEHLCEHLVRLFAAIFEGIAKLLTAVPAHVARAYRWLGWQSPRGCVRQIVTRATMPSCAHPLLPSQRRREAAQR